MLRDLKARGMNPDYALEKKLRISFSSFAFFATLREKISRGAAKNAKKIKKEIAVVIIKTFFTRGFPNA